MDCSNCQRKLKDGDTFCGFCGQVIVLQQTSAEPELSAVEVTEFDEASVEVEADQESTSQKQSDHVEPPVVEQSKHHSEPEEVRTGAAAQGANFRTVWLLSVFLGWLGVDRFYLGLNGTGIVKFLGAGWYGVWWAIDLVRLVTGKQRDKSGTAIVDPHNFRPTAKVITTVLVTLVALFWLLIIAASVSAVLQGDLD
jgi:TM2 domain-containing membrane protein YozV/uncharacterized Zn finger protein (UPF0148 family)